MLEQGSNHTTFGLSLHQVIILMCGQVVGEIYPVVETDQFVRNCEHCSAASYGCGTESSMLLAKLHFNLPTGAHLLLMER